MAPKADPPGLTVEDATSEPSHIGVARGFEPPSHVGTITRRFDREERAQVQTQISGTVRYETGAEFAPLNTPNLVLQLQAQLVQIGYLDPEKVRPGIWDSTSASAYRKTLAYANQHGISAQEAIQEIAANPTLGELQGPSRKPLTVELTNPLDIAATAQSAAQKLLGRSLSDEELKPFIANVQGLQESAQRKAYSIGGTKGSGGVAVVQPTQESSYGADDYFKKNYGEERAGYAAIERMNDFYGLLNSPVSGAGQ